MIRGPAARRSTLSNKVTRATQHIGENSVSLVVRRRAFILLTVSVTLAANVRSQPVETITVHAQAPARPFPHFWEQVFGSGRAILSLRESYRRDLRAMKAATGIRIRPISRHPRRRSRQSTTRTPQGRPVYNWSYVDQIYDGLLANGVRPFVELSFMPRKLAASLEPARFLVPTAAFSTQGLRPKWGELVYNFAQHLVDRYGIEEVSNGTSKSGTSRISIFGPASPSRPRTSSCTITRRAPSSASSPRLRVGGPATAQAAWVDAMIAHCVEANVPLDFVSTHVYANDSAEDVFGTDESIPRSDMVARAVRKVHDQVKASARPDLPIHWSEYNASYKNEIEVTDSAFMGPWLANNIRLCDGLATTCRTGPSPTFSRSRAW